MNVSRRSLILGAAGAGAAVAVPTLLPFRADSGAPARLPASKFPEMFTVPFAHAPVAQPIRRDATTDYYRISLEQFTAELLPGIATSMYGYNGSFPGPTIRATRGRTVIARFENNLPSMHPAWAYESFANIHLHGGASLPQYDGYASDIIHPGHYKDYVWLNTECGRSAWYHDHAMHHTSLNVYAGLAGRYLVDDPAEFALGLPRGEFDVSLQLSDAMFQADGGLYASLVNTKGLWGDVLLVNGRPWPVMKVKRRKYRFRMVNACGSRTFFLRLSTGDPMVVVGSDAGLAPAPIPVPAFRITNGERYDFVVDFAEYPAGTRVELINDSLPYNDDYPTTGKVMAFDVVDDAFDPANNDVPRELAPSNPVMTTPTPAQPTIRNIKTIRQGGEWTINGNTWNDVIDSQYGLVEATVLKGATEIWEFQNNSGGWSHPMHVHGVDARIISRNGMAPYAYENCPKDVFRLGENETIRVQMTFREPGKYMIHCHNVVHEDHDMMSQYECIDPNGPAADSPFSASAEPLLGAREL